MSIIRFRRGNKADLPSLAPSGLPLWCEDTKELYIGTDSGVTPVIINNNYFPNFMPYSVNSGNVDVNGYPDIINKVSDTEVSFKVGGLYPFMGVTFANGNRYIISSISNIANLINNEMYIFIILEDNLIPQGNGTYTATAIAVTDGNIFEEMKFPEGYDESILPVMTSNNSEGWTASASTEWGASFAAWKAFDGITNSSNSGWESTACPGWLKILKNNGTFNISKIAITSTTETTYAPKTFTIKDQFDNILASFNNQVFGIYETKYFNVTGTGISTVKIDVTENNGGHNISIGEVKLYKKVISANGNYHLLINQRPMMPYLRQNSMWIEKQFLKIGKIVKTNEIIAAPQTYAFNGQFIGTTGLESDIGSIFTTVLLSNGQNLYKRGF